MTRFATLLVVRVCTRHQRTDAASSVAVARTASPATKGDGGTPLQNPPTRPITDKVSPPDPDQAAVPTLTQIDPTVGVVGSVGPTMILTGTGFVPRSVMTVDGQELDTTFESDTEVAATIPDAKLTALGQLSITVQTPPPGGGETAPLTFTVQNPPPAVIELDPLSIPSGTGDTNLTVVGTTFVKGSTIHFGTTDPHDHVHGRSAPYGRHPSRASGDVDERPGDRNDAGTRRRHVHDDCVHGLESRRHDYERYSVDHRGLCAGFPHFRRRHRIRRGKRHPVQRNPAGDDARRPW